MTTRYIPGLQGVVAAETSMSRVDGQRGELIIAGFELEELANYATFEETVYLLWNGRLPTQSEHAQFQKAVADQRQLPDATLDLLTAVAAKNVPPMDALRMAAGTLSLNLNGQQESQRQTAIALTARFPTIMAAYWRLLHQQSPIAQTPSSVTPLTISTCSPEKCRAMPRCVGWKPTSTPLSITASTPLPLLRASSLPPSQIWFQPLWVRLVP